ncbi:hypothetical protein KC19_2G186100 [Ceratodon purpureus]|uniref:Uncharacterized protein n=1 Tax=Ceratodon purpureus TaxID=3225 RepID=A0A8T0IVG3_CERPU|nr:hypothetical protein KC19_2G186100 [Ceratodon purpureus]
MPTRISQLRTLLGGLDCPAHNLSTGHSPITQTPKKLRNSRRSLISPVATPTCVSVAVPFLFVGYLSW